MPLTQTSVSALTLADPTQKGGCARRWWFEAVKGLKPEQADSASDGEAGHGLLATWLSGGGAPAKRVKMGKAVTGVILKGDLPLPGTDLLVEERFDYGPKLDAAGAWRPFDPAKTLRSTSGVAFDGFVDLQHARDGIPTVIDHKFKADLTDKAQFPADLCEPDDLIKTIQMPVYAVHASRRWPGARKFRLVHHYVSRRGVISKIVSAVVDLDQVGAQWQRVNALVDRLKPLADVEDQNEVPFNRGACTAWLGCPHQSICRAFKENQVALTPEEEAALFDDAPPAAPASAPEPDPLDEVAMLEAQIAAAKLKKAAAAAAAEAAAAKAKVDAEAAAAAAKPAKQPRLAKIVDSDLPIGPQPVSTPPPADYGTCAACSATLTADNASRSASGTKHIDCPAAAAQPAPAPAPEPAKRGRPPKPSTPDSAYQAAVKFLLDVMEGKIADPVQVQAAGHLLSAK